jgi:hypothetical protein
MTGADWGPIVQAVIAAIAMAFTTLAGIYIPKVLAAVERQTHIALTDQERAAIQSAVTTAAGLIQNKLDQGVLRPRDITPGNLAVVDETIRALATVPNAAAAQGTTLETASAMVASRVDIAPKPVVAPVVAAVIAPKEG